MPASNADLPPGQWRSLILGMSACHTKPFIGSGVLLEPNAAAPTAIDPGAASLVAESCDYCGAITLEWRKCKLICTNCRQINKSCADL
jgi:hypothetical protein